MPLEASQSTAALSTRHRKPKRSFGVTWRDATPGGRLPLSQASGQKAAKRVRTSSHKDETEHERSGVVNSRIGVCQGGKVSLSFRK